MNERGKLKHRIHLLVFRRGERFGKPLLHVVTRKGRLRSVFRRLFGRSDSPLYGILCVGWVADEPYWREHGLGGRP